MSVAWKVKRIAGLLLSVVVIVTQLGRALGVCQTSQVWGQSAPRQEVTLTPVGHFGGWTASVAADPAGGYVYAGMGSGLAVFDISDPSAPRQVGSLPLDGYDLSGIAVLGSNAVVIGGCHLSVVDLSDRTAPALLGSVELDPPLWGAKAYYLGTTAYVAGGVKGLHVYDLSDPSRPERVGGTTSGTARDVFVAGTTAYVAAGTDGLQVYDVSDPSSIGDPIGTYDTTGDSQSIEVVGDTAYLADGDAGGLVIVDISDPTDPGLVGEYISTGRAESLVVNGDTVYLADGRDSALIVLDISNPAAPSEVTTTAGDWNPLYLALDGDTLCVGGERRGLRLLDVSTPASPSPLSDSAWPNNIVDMYLPDPSLVAAAPRSQPRVHARRDYGGRHDHRGPVRHGNRFLHGKPSPRTDQPRPGRPQNHRGRGRVPGVRHGPVAGRHTGIREPCQRRSLEP